MNRTEYESGRAYARFAYSNNPARRSTQFFKQCREGAERLAVEYCKLRVKAFGNPDPLESESMHGQSGADAVKFRALWIGSGEPTLLSPDRYKPSRLPK